MKRFVLPLVTGLTLIAAPAWAESWILTPIVFTDGSQLYIDSASVKRNWRDTDKISYRIQVQSYLNGTATGRISGNCKTGTWRLTSSKSNGVSLILSDAIGVESLKQACYMPYSLTQPRR